MIPTADETPRRRTPWVTWGLIVVNVLIFVYELLQGQDLEQFIMRWGAVPAYIADTANHPMAWLTLLTSTFLHGGWLHLIGNMLYLYIFGDNVEDRLGHLGYLVFYLSAGVLAGLAQVLTSLGSTIPGVGASGAIAGVLGAYLVMYPRAPVRVLVPGLFLLHMARLPAIIVLGFWFILQLLNGFLSLGTATMATTGGTAWFAHIGGFVVGLLMGLVLRLQRRRAY